MVIMCGSAIFAFLFFRVCFMVLINTRLKRLECGVKLMFVFEQIRNYFKLSQNDTLQ